MHSTERLVRQIADAMADGTPIGWDALLSQSREPSERRGLECLRALEHLRVLVPFEGHASINRAADAAVVAVAVTSGLQVAAATGTLLMLVAAGAPFSWPLPQFAITMAFGASTILLLRSRRDRRALPLLSAYAAAAAAFCRPFVHAGDQMGWFAPLFLGVVTDAFLPACFWHFAAQFPRVQRFTSLDRFVRLMTGLAFAVASVLLGANIAGEYKLLSPRLAAPLMRGSALYWGLFAVLLLSSVATVFWRATRAAPDERRRVRRFGTWLLGGITPFLIWQLAFSLLPSVRRWAVATPVPRGRPVIEGIVLAGFMLTPILTAAAVVIDRALEFDVLIRRATQYALARATLSAVVVVPFAVLASVVYVNRDRRVMDLLSGGAARMLLVTGIVAFILLVGRIRLLDLLDRAFLRNRLDHRAHLAAALSRIRNARSQREVAAILADEGATVLGAERLVIFVAGPGDRLTAEIGDVPHLPLSAAVAALAQGEEQLIDLSRDSSSYELLPREDRAWLDATGLAIFIPIRHRSGRLVALLALGPKRDRLVVTSEEQWLMLSLTTAVAAIWDTIDSAATETHHQTFTRGSHDGSAVECGNCGIVAERPPLPCACHAGTRVASLPAMLQQKFRVTRRLGQGAMGVVYLGRDVDLARDVALKTLPTVTGAAIDRLRQEARAMATVGHEALAVIYGFEVWRDTPVLVVEYFRGGTLADRLMQGRLPVPLALRLGMRLAGGLAALHAAGLLHRDVKPTNIGLTVKGAAKLLDFGVAGLVDGFGELAGTPLYWPPEAFEGAGTSVAFDLWALNTVLYQAVAGRHPAAGTAREGLTQWWRSSPGPLPLRRSELPDAVNAYFERALSIQCEERWTSAAAVEQELAALFRIVGEPAQAVRIEGNGR